MHQIWAKQFNWWMETLWIKDFKAWGIVFYVMVTVGLTVFSAILTGSTVAISVAQHLVNTGFCVAATLFAVIINIVFTVMSWIFGAALTI